MSFSEVKKMEFSTVSPTVEKHAVVGKASCSLNRNLSVYGNQVPTTFKQDNHLQEMSFSEVKKMEFSTVSPTVEKHAVVGKASCSLNRNLSVYGNQVPTTFTQDNHFQEMSFREVKKVEFSAASPGVEKRAVVGKASCGVNRNLFLKIEKESILIDSDSDEESAAEKVCDAKVEILISDSEQEEEDFPAGGASASSDGYSPVVPILGPRGQMDTVLRGAARFGSVLDL